MGSGGTPKFEVQEALVPRLPHHELGQMISLGLQHFTDFDIFKMG